MAKTLEAAVTLAEGMHFQGHSGSGFTVSLDASDEAGGMNQGVRPMELLLMGLAGCTGMDVISILRKMQQDVTGYEVRVRGERGDEHPKTLNSIAVEHRVTGRNLAADRVRRAVDLSANKYCSASAMLSKAAQVVHEYVIIDADTSTEVHRERLSP